MCMLLLIPNVLGLFAENRQFVRSYTLFEKQTDSVSLMELRPGDIAFKHPEAFRGPVIIDHCLLCIDYDNVTDTYEFVEAHYHYGVQRRFEKRSNLSRLEWGPFARVITASDEQKKNAIDFAILQVGKEFQKDWINKNYNPLDIENDSLANEWYCSELIWAAYYNCNNSFMKAKRESDYIYGDGIDIDRNGWNGIKDFVIVAPRDILYDREVIRLFIDVGQKTRMFSSFFIF